MVRLVLTVLAVWCVTPVHAQDRHDLLLRALAQWSRDVGSWSFVQHVEEYRGDRVTERRVEKFDPSQPDHRRWELVSIDGRAPTEAERRAFDTRKNRRPRARVEEPGRYIDLKRVRVVAEDAASVTYDVTLRGDLSVFVPFELVAARVEVERATARVLSVDIGLRREMRIAFGIARLTHLAMRFDMALSAGETAPTDRYSPPATVKPATATLFLPGRRAEISWTDFVRVRS